MCAPLFLLTFPSSGRPPVRLQCLEEQNEMCVREAVHKIFMDVIFFFVKEDAELF